MMAARSLLVLCTFCLAACSLPAPQPPEKSDPIRSADSSVEASAGAVRAAHVKLRTFDYRKGDAHSASRKKLRSIANIVTEKASMTVNDPLRKMGTFEQEYLYYHIPDAEPRPTVVLLTLFGEEIFMDRITARSFCRKGFNVLMVLPAQVLGDNDRPFTEANETLIRNIITARMGIDMLEQHFPETDSDRIYTYGTSMGGVRAAMLFGVEPRIKRAWVITGGGDIPAIVSDTEYGTLVKLRESRMEAENLPDIASLRVHLDRVLTVDPLDFASLREPEDIAFVISTNDSYVKTPHQEKLFKAFSRPDEGRFPAVAFAGTKHMTTGTRIPTWTSRFAKFFAAYSP